MTPRERVDRGARHPRDELAAYAVDALDGDERRATGAHLEACPSCRRELAAHQEVLARLTGDERPPPELWERIAVRTREPDAGPRGDADRHEGDVLPLDAARRPRHLARRRGRAGRRVAIAALAAAAAVVVAVGVVPRVWDGDGEGPGSGEVALELPVGPIVAADGTEVARVGADDRGSFVEMVRLDPLPAARTYQLWSLDGPDPVSLGLLGRATDPVVRVDVPAGTTRVAVSDEPAGGSPRPTGLIAGTGNLATPA